MGWGCPPGVRWRRLAGPWPLRAERGFTSAAQPASPLPFLPHTHTHQSFPMSSRGPLLASPGLGHLPGAPTGVGSAGPRCLHHVLSGRPAAALMWGRPAPRLGHQRPRPGCLCLLGSAQPREGLQSAWAWAAVLGSSGSVFPPCCRAQNGPWGPLPDTALAPALPLPAFFLPPDHMD